jgi:hypothetical protein
MGFVWCFIISAIGVGLYELKQHTEYGGHDFEGLLTVLLSFPISALLYLVWTVLTA